MKSYMKYFLMIGLVSGASAVVVVQGDGSSAEGFKSQGDTRIPYGSNEQSVGSIDLRPMENRY